MNSARCLTCQMFKFHFVGIFWNRLGYRTQGIQKSCHLPKCDWSVTDLPWHSLPWKGNRHLFFLLIWTPKSPLCFSIWRIWNFLDENSASFIQKMFGMAQIMDVFYCWFIHTTMPSGYLSYFFSHHWHESATHTHTPHTDLKKILWWWKKVHVPVIQKYCSAFLC